MVIRLYKQAWKVLNTDVELLWPETIVGGVDAGEKVLKLAKALDENRNIKELEPVVSSISSLIDVLNLPLVQVAGESLPFISIATKLLKFFLDQTHQEPSLEVCVELAAQAAYLESLRLFLRSSDNREICEKLPQMPASQKISQEIKKLGETSHGESILDDREAEKTLVCFHESKLARIFNSILISRLMESGLSNKKAEIITERISRKTHRYIKRILVEMRDSVTHLAALYGNNWQRDLEIYQSIDSYLDEVIAKKPYEKVFDEPFSFRDIYVSQKVKSVKNNGQVDDTEEGKDIQKWAIEVLQDPNKQGQVIFIQGGPGRGKSVFCRMFADWIRQEIYPIWIPILIRLRDVEISPENNFEKTLQLAVDKHFSLSDNAWLNDRNMRFLFFLDGFDELLLERGGGGLKGFLKQVGSFQTRCQENREKSHRIIITGRHMALYGLQDDLPPNLERAEIILMDSDIQNAWLAKWEILAGKDASLKLRSFLDDDKCSNEIKQLSREPLLLYLLAKLLKDRRKEDNLCDGALKQIGNEGGKIQIYEEIVDWVLTKQRSEKSIRNLTYNYIDKIDDLRSVLEEVALCVIQSNVGRTTISAIKQRLRQKGDDRATALFKEAEQDPESSLLKASLTAFYINPASDEKTHEENSVEFVHKSFGEFLFAKRLWVSLNEWSSPGYGRRKYLIPENNLVEEVYDLLGYGVLTLGIVEYLSALLQKYPVDTINLFERLCSFYFWWSNKGFINKLEGSTLPQNKARQLTFYTGQHVVDIVTGVNVLILLLELHRYAQTKDDLRGKIIYHPCRQEKSDDTLYKEYPGNEHLLRTIYYVCSYDTDTFSRALGQFLKSSNLSHAYLAGAPLDGVDLSSTNLIRVNLSGSSLISSDLSNANLSHANLSGINLSNANLSGADLSHAYLKRASFDKILWSNNTKWMNARFLHEVIDIPEDLEKQTDFSIATLLSKAIDQAWKGNIEQAIALYNQVEKAITEFNNKKDLDQRLEVSANSWNALCWSGTLNGFANEVMPACEKAVTLDPEEGQWRDSRGLARALIRDMEGAIEDFQYAVNSEGLGESQLPKRQRWLESLQAGENPFTSEELEALRKDE